MVTLTIILGSLCCILYIFIILIGWSFCVVAARADAHIEKILDEMKSDNYSKGG